jgi:putative membrane protein
MQLDHSTALALNRTYLALERTLMAWIRTATSMISFGFSIYKFFQYVVETEKVSFVASRIGPRKFALGMISLGIIALALATWQHRNAMKLLAKEYGTTPPSIAGKIAAIVSIGGLLVLLMVILRE